MRIFIGVAATSAAILFGAAAWAQTPVFSDPTNITNPYAPFESGSVQVSAGRDEGARTTTVWTHLEETRTFDYAGQVVECCILEEKAFSKGRLVEISVHYLAQDDQGHVRYFGEVSVEFADDDEEDDEGETEEDSWIVGGATQEGDPPGVYNANDPTTFMPADPQVGDTFKQEDFPAQGSFPGLSETLEVIASDVKVRVPAGTFTTAIKLRETNEIDGGPPEHLWVVPGVGIVREKAKGTRTKLIATSLDEVPPGELP